MILGIAAWAGFFFVSTSPEPLRITFIGDSLTAGYGLSPSFAYPALLEKKFNSETEVKIKSINAGVSGDTTAGGLRRLNWQLKSKPDLVIIALGANDMLRGIPPEKTKENLKTMISHLRLKNIPVVLFGMLAGSNLGISYQKKFDSIYSDLSREFNLALYPFLLKDVAKVAELNLEDGIHPNAKGQEVIASHLFQFLKPVLKSLWQKKLEVAHP